MLLIQKYFETELYDENYQCVPRDLVHMGGWLAELGHWFHLAVLSRCVTLSSLIFILLFICCVTLSSLIFILLFDDVFTRCVTLPSLGQVIILSFNDVFTHS